ncbi:hypothetical protein Goarm_001071, partial [Gossypium armourianum]|nr:hypothetical protein [Gossypium armourianum]
SPFSTITRKPNRYSVVCEAAPKKKADSAAKRDRQAKKRQIYNKAKKFQVKTRMKKGASLHTLFHVNECLALLGMASIILQPDAAYSVMDKAVKVGTLHGNTGARTKSVLQGERRLLKSTTVDQLQMQPRRGSML